MDLEMKPDYPLDTMCHICGGVEDSKKQGGAGWIDQNVLNQNTHRSVLEKRELDVLK